MSNFTTPNKTFIGSSSPALERSLILNQNKRKIKNSFVWGAINAVFLSVLLYDVFYTSPIFLNYWHYAEYAIVIIVTLNIFFHLFHIIKYFIVNSNLLVVNKIEKKQGEAVTEPSFRVIEKMNISEAYSSSTPTRPVNSIIMGNCVSPDTSQLSFSPASWSMMKNQSQSSYSNSPKSFSAQISPRTIYGETSMDEFINDENSLQRYLKDYEESEKVDKVNSKTQDSVNLLSSFWTHPVAKTVKDMSSFLRRFQYQLSVQSTSGEKTGSPRGKVEDSTLSQTAVLEVWSRINVDIVALTQWNENLRKWISQTILQRLVTEFDRINDTLEKHAMGDIKIGKVGLDKLRKTAQMANVAQYIPSLSTLIPFLEVTPNQEYLEKRIRELSRGGCMSEFKWNGGSSYNGKDWDDSLPTDCAILMHLLASYLDTQLLPMPSMPDMRAFSGHHYIRYNDKMPILTPNSLFIHQVSEKPPHYRVIVGEKVYEMIKGYNNLFHSILFFIYHVNKVQHGMLGRVNLGRAGVNMLWIIDQ